MPAAFRYPLAVSRRTPVACSIRRKDQPSLPKAIICCRLSSLNPLLMPREATLPPRVVNVPGDYFSMAGFEVTYMLLRPRFLAKLSPDAATNYRYA